MPGGIREDIVYGAGVIGTLYAARLQEGGHRVTVVARGQRLADIRRYGLVLEDIVGHGRSTTRVDTIERVDPNDQYDIALISVRRDQVASVVPEFTTDDGQSARRNHPVPPPNHGTLIISSRSASPSANVPTVKYKPSYHRQYRHFIRAPVFLTLL